MIAMLSTLLMVGIVIALMVIGALAGMLHTVAGTSIVDHSAGNAANIAALLSGGGAIGAEASVQSRNGVVPTLIGADATEDKGGAMAGESCKISYNTDRSTDYLYVLPRRLTLSRELLVNPYAIVGAPIPLQLEADLNAFYTSSGAVDHFLALYFSYAPAIPSTNGRQVHRSGTVTAADYSTTAAFGTAVSINDLNPSRWYRVLGLGGIGGTDCGIVRIRAPSFNGMCIQALIPEGTESITMFPHDSQIFSGVETLSLDAAGGAASTCYYHLILEEYAQVPGAGPTDNKPIIASPPVITGQGQGGVGVRPTGGNTAGGGRVGGVADRIKSMIR